MSLKFENVALWSLFAFVEFEESRFQDSRLYTVYLFYFLFGLFSQALIKTLLKNKSLFQILTFFFID